MTTPEISTPVSLPSFIDAASDAVARAIAGMQRQATQERELRDAEHRARLAELDVLKAEVTALKQQAVDRLAEIKDGEPGRDGVDGVDGRDGADAAPITAEQVSEAVREALTPEGGREDPVAREVERWLRANPPAAGQDGRDGADGKDGEQGERGFGLDDFDTELAEEGRTLLLKFTRGEHTEAHEIPLPVGPAGADGQDGERGAEGPVGALPIVTEWADGVHYQGEVVTHLGAAFQAIRDTGKEPGHEDWRCIIGRGKDGADGRSITPRGLFDEGKTYSALDIVMLNGASFIAKADEPGPCPGEGWNLLAAQGKQGKPGLPGERGERGLAVTASVRSAEVSHDALLTLTNADGSKVECDLYPVLSKL